jgi:hypothetical protein
MASGSVAAHGAPPADLVLAHRRRGRVVSKFGRGAERAFLGAVMALLAFLVERRVLRALRRSRY